MNEPPRDEPCDFCGKPDTCHQYMGVHFQCGPYASTDPLCCDDCYTPELVAELEAQEDFWRSDEGIAENARIMRNTAAHFAAPGHDVSTCAKCAETRRGGAS
ncbi:hypothetical protein OH805_08835 [Streptomyces sp. NBC_00879]|uniref:hypothetical protein n=1 Tax=Streptomyces sp. NBC_00879 TaxID=2975855 RepID=UPI00386A2F76|nr:hypothetical protein OH805_08835 [Streptomyces sp. NBC_00879]